MTLTQHHFNEITPPRCTIIIPVYNSFDYLETCVKSITAQTFKDWELLLIDDGSDQKTADLCDQIANDVNSAPGTHGTAQVHHKENGGTSSARNAGLALAKGTYVTFMDNDDFWFDDTGLARAMALLEETNADLLMHHSVLYDHKNAELKKTTRQLPDLNGVQGNKIKLLQAINRAGFMERAVWGKIVRRQLIQEHNILFPEGMRNEDTDWTARVLTYARTIVYLAESFYAYRKGHEYAQTSKPITTQQVLDLVEVLEQRSSEISHASIPDEEKAAVYAYLAYPYTVLLGQSRQFSSKTLGKDTYKRIKDLDWLLAYASDPTSNLAKTARRLLGHNLAAKALGFEFKRRYPNA